MQGEMILSVYLEDKFFSKFHKGRCDKALTWSERGKICRDKRERGQSWFSFLYIKIPC